MQYAPRAATITLPPSIGGAGFFLLPSDHVKKCGRFLAAIFYAVHYAHPKFPTQRQEVPR